MSQTESFRASREALVLRLWDQEKLTFQQIGDRFDRSDCRAAQIYQAARHKIQFPTNGLSNRLNRLLTLSGFTVEKKRHRQRPARRQTLSGFPAPQLWYIRAP